MREEKRKQTKLVPQTIMVEQEEEVTLYITDDGKEFFDADECREYDMKISIQNAIAEAEKLRVIEMDNLIPISTDCLNGDVPYYWYKLSSESDFYAVKKAWEDTDNFFKPKQYPCYYAVEDQSWSSKMYEGHPDDFYGWDSTVMLQATVQFWKKLGFQCTITKDGDR